MVFIFNGVDAGLCRPMNRDEVFNILNLSPRKNYVGFIGYLYPWSGLESLIEAAPKVISKLPDVSFIIVGHGHWGEHLQSLTLKHHVQDNFLFTGYQPWDMIPLYCNAFDVGITPYVGEKGIGRYRSSMKTLEYMAAGTPVIITHAEGVSDIVENAGCGIVIPPDDSNALANAITKIIGNPKKGQEMGESGRDVVLANFTWNHTVTRMIGFIENVS
jgi:glycosyltransferase involved in cell wall biosynthesis